MELYKKGHHLEIIQDIPVNTTSDWDDQIYQLMDTMEKIDVIGKAATKVARSLLTTKTNTTAL